MRNFAEMVAETFESVDRAVARIGNGCEALVEAHNVRTLLVDLPEIAQRDPGLNAAADDLHAACLACARAAGSGGVDPHQRRLLQEAASRFEEHLSTARPGEVAGRLCQ